MRTRLTISQAFDLIPSGGEMLMPGIIAEDVRREAERRNKRLSGDWYSVTMVTVRDVAYIAVARHEAWDIAREDVVANDHRYYKTNRWLFA